MVLAGTKWRVSFGHFNLLSRELSSQTNQWKDWDCLGGKVDLDLDGSARSVWEHIDRFERCGNRELSEEFPGLAPLVRPRNLHNTEVVLSGVRCVRLANEYKLQIVGDVACFVIDVHFHPLSPIDSRDAERILRDWMMLGESPNCKYGWLSPRMKITPHCERILNAVPEVVHPYWHCTNTEDAGLPDWVPEGITIECEIFDM